DRPDVGAAGLVLLDVDLRHDERDALAVWRALRIADFFQLAEVVERERPLPGLSPWERHRRKDERQHRQRAFHTVSWWPLFSISQDTTSISLTCSSAFEQIASVCTFQSLEET